MGGSRKDVEGFAASDSKTYVPFQFFLHILSSGQTQLNQPRFFANEVTGVIY